MREILHAWRESGRNSVQARLGGILPLNAGELTALQKGRVSKIVNGVTPYTAICARASSSSGSVPQQYSTNENPSLSRNNFLANLMHGHSDSSFQADPEVAFRKLPSKDFFMFYFIVSKSD